MKQALDSHLSHFSIFTHLNIDQPKSPIIDGALMLGRMVLFLPFVHCLLLEAVPLFVVSIFAFCTLPLFVVSIFAVCTFPLFVVGGRR